jgi:integrase
MPRTSKARKRARGEIETLPSGSLRVRVYAGIDPVSKKRHYLVETVPAGPNAAREAEMVRTRLLNQVDEKRNPRTKATVNQLMDRYLEVLDVEPTTRSTYEGYIRNHIRPLLGDLSVGRLDGEVLDSFYAALRTCRAHCRGRKYVEHRSVDTHDCDDRCRPHKCRPLADASIRQIHGILSGACKRAVRWRWIGANPIEQAEPPSPARPDPHPPTPEQAARIATEAWRDLDWGMLVWLALVTGARRGELCALRWDRIDFATGVLSIRSSIAQSGAETWEKDTKTHQQRRITLDNQTLALLRAYLRRCTERAAAVGLTLPATARVFSPTPDGSTWLKPDTVTQRYARMCARLGWDMNIHQLRHYSATELIAAGVDVRTVAGRLGHSGGGSTTLRVYSAWVSEADQRAAGALAGRMPPLPVGLEVDGALPAPSPDPVTDDAAPYMRMVEDLRAAIRCGALRQGDPLPAMVDLAARYQVAPSTAHRAVAILAAAGEVVVSRGKRAVVAG